MRFLLMASPIFFFFDGIKLLLVCLLVVLESKLERRGMNKYLMERKVRRSVSPDSERENKSLENPEEPPPEEANITSVDSLLFIFDDGVALFACDEPFGDDDVRDLTSFLIDDRKSLT